MSGEAEHSGAGGEVRFRRRRRRWSEARKRLIGAESYQPGVSVSVVARRHDVNANLVFSWRRQYRELARVVGGFVLVVVSSTEGAEPAKLLPAPPDIEPQPSGRMEIALADGSRVTVDRDVDPPAALFRYSRNRSGDHPVEHLRGYAGKRAGRVLDHVRVGIDPQLPDAHPFRARTTVPVLATV